MTIMENLQGWTTEPVLPCGENVDKLREDIFYFLQAFRQPILEFKEEDGKEELIEIKEEQPLNRGHYFEFLDRTFVAMEYIYQFLGCHPVLRKEKKLSCPTQGEQDKDMRKSKILSVNQSENNQV